MKAMCPVDGCEYIAFGDDDKELKKDLRYHLMDIHHINRVPEKIKCMEENVKS
jgi:predicted small metal-binding protein